MNSDELPGTEKPSTKAKQNSLMSTLWLLPAALTWLVSWLWRMVGLLLTTIFGRANYQPPLWLERGSRAARAHPWRTIAALVLVLGAGYGIKQWLDYVPPEPPNLVHVTLTPPTPTDYSVDEPYFSSMSIDFDASVAPIGASGSGDFVPVGISMSPQLPGTWRWNSDQSLSFNPSGDWPVNTTIRVRYDAKRTLAPHVVVDHTSFEFKTAPMSVAINNEFSQDPTNPLLKQAVYTLQFSHPVDPSSLESKLKLLASANTRRFPEATLVANDPLKSTGFKVSYDEKKLTAYVTTDALKIPDAGALLALAMDKGVQSSVQIAMGEADHGAESALSELELPSLYSLTVDDLQLATAENAEGNPEQISIVVLNESISSQAMGKALQVVLLPRNHPDHVKNGLSTREPYAWSTNEISQSLLASGQKLALTAIPGERDVMASHSFRYTAPIGRYVYLQIAKNTTAFGGTKLAEAREQVLKVPDFPKALSFVGDGSLLSLKGERKLSVLARNIYAFRLEVRRVLPDQLQHFVRYGSNGAIRPSFYGMDEDSLIESFSQVVYLPELQPGQSHFEGIDLSQYFTPEKHGVFHIYLREMNLRPEFEAMTRSEITEAQLSEGSKTDHRMIVLSDLGALVKTSLDQSRHVFVQQLHDGAPAAGVEVDVIGANGISVGNARTDASGYAKLDDYGDFRNERSPILLRFVRNGDLSFLPARSYEREQDFSRFDIGGEDTPTDKGTLSAHAFSDRGLYRPGDLMHFGVILRAYDWNVSMAGLPIFAVITDPSDTELYANSLTVGESGFTELDFQTAESGASGGYTLSIYRGTGEQRSELLGQTSVQVKEFLPDQMKIATRFSQAAGSGWLKPEGVEAIVQLDTLFGTPAQDRRVTAQLSLSPTVPSFASFPGFQFFDPYLSKESHFEELQEQQSDATGSVRFALGLEKYSSGTFWLNVSTEGFEAGSGRSVTDRAQTLVSTNDFLIGLKSADSLSYVKKDSKRTLQIVAVNQSAQATAVGGLRVKLKEHTFVSVLTKQNSGVYKYVSQPRDVLVHERELALKADITQWPMDTSKPGNFSLAIENAEGVELNAIRYTVAGAANLTRSLERNAELELNLAKTEYTPGDELEVSIRAPYPGSGLISIERDQIYAYQWFSADKESSVHKIRIPEGLEGTAYLSVQFVRSPDSKEVFMSPLSYGAVPFRLNRQARTLDVQVKAPPRSKPGTVLNFDVQTDEAADVAVFAIDEGILQVAGYQLRDPLDDFFPKRRLQVDTAQILDMILPEFSRLLSAAAPGGGDEEALNSNLNPFKRKRDKPAAYWSGIQRVEGKAQFQYTPPEYFNGTLKVFAVAVNAARIGIFRGQAQVRGDFVLQVNTPTVLAPGDRFSAAVNVSYPKNDELSEAELATEKTIELTLSLDPGLSLVDPNKAKQTINLRPGGEGVVHFDVQAARDASLKLGNASLRVNASAAGTPALSALRTASLSIRPATAYVSSLRVGRMDEKQKQLGDLRLMWPEFSRRELVAGTTPLVLARGLAGYLQDFPHACSEQLSSQGFAQLALIAHPELTPLSASGELPMELNAILSQLAARQNSSGGYGLWDQTPVSEPFVSAYVGWLIQEAKDRGVAKANAMWPATERYLKALANDGALEQLHELRHRALAIYVLTRAGVITTAEIASLQQTIERTMPEAGKKDLTSLLLAASLKLMKVSASEQRARAAVEVLAQDKLPAIGYANYFDENIDLAWTTYLLYKHFPEQAKNLPPRLLERLLVPISEGTNNTLSSALTILALESAAQTRPAPQFQFHKVLDSGAKEPFGTAQGLLYSGTWAPPVKALELSNAAGGASWFALSEAGFDQNPLANKTSVGIEVSKRYETAGRALNGAITVGDELTVVLQIRSTDQKPHHDIALIDLLPGGFEALSLQSQGSPPQSQEVREDRVVLYLSATPETQEFRYGIKATNAGKFVRPRSYAYSMYERKIQSTESDTSDSALLNTGIEVNMPSK